MLSQVNPISLVRKIKWQTKAIVEAKSPFIIIYFLTNKCNMKCNHCFYWQNINKEENELSLDEIEKIIKSLKYPIFHLLLTGGEPFILQELDKICELFVKINKTKNIQIATNGFETKKIIKKVKKILNLHCNIHLQISIDGLPQTHNKIRGINDSFENAVITAKEIKKLQNEHKNLTIHILTVITKMNINEINELANFIINEIKLPITFEIVRGNKLFNNEILDKKYNPKENVFISINELNKVYDNIKNIYLMENDKLGVNLNIPLFILKKSIEIIKYQRKLFNCVAGREIATLYSNGEVSGCELIHPFATIRDYDYNFTKLWQATCVKEFREKIKNCFCSHGCFIEASLFKTIKYGFIYTFNF